MNRYINDEVREARRRMALGLRNMRADNPPLARLFWRRMKLAERRTIEALWNEQGEMKVGLL